LRSIFKVYYFLFACRKYIDHGPIFYSDGSVQIYVNSIAISGDGIKSVSEGMVVASCNYVKTLSVKNFY